MATRKFRMSVVLLTVALWLPAARGADERAPYPFRRPPHEAVELLAKANLGKLPAIDPSEWTLLDEVWKLRNLPASPATTAKLNAHAVDCLLAASGVTAADERTRYRDKITALTAEARKVVASAKTDPERADALLRFLHAGVMKEGYESGQTSLSALFDTGKFNCVSSTALYYLVGKELGLKLKIVSMAGGFAFSGHMAVDLMLKNGSVDIEPTNADGYDAQAKSQKPGVIVIGFGPSRDGAVEIDALGMAAAIYSNRCVAASQAENPDRAAAASLGFRALAVDPHDAQAAENVAAVFMKWADAELDARHCETALHVYRVGAATTGHGDLLHNYAIAYLDYIVDLLQQKKDEQAMRALAAAHAAFPEDRDFLEAERPWVVYGEKVYSDAGWQASLTVAERALVHLKGEDAARLRAWRTSCFRYASKGRLEAEDAAGSLAILRHGMKIDLQDAELHEALAYHLQESLAFLDKPAAGKTTDHAAALAEYRLLTKEYPQLPDLHTVALRHAARAVERLSSEEKFAEAVAAAISYRDFVEKNDDWIELQARAWDDWARGLAGKNDYEASLAKYLEARKKLPGNGYLQDRMVGMFDNWAEYAAGETHFERAVAVYDRGLKLLPDDGHLLNNRAYYQQKIEPAK